MSIDKSSGPFVNSRWNENLHLNDPSSLTHYLLQLNMDYRSNNIGLDLNNKI